MSSQLPLGLRLIDRCDFASFYPGPNAALLRELRAFTGPHGSGLVYLQGEPSTGKSHLLQASVRQLTQQGGSGAYLPLLMAGEELNPAALGGLESLDLVCLDDVDRGAQAEDWDSGLAALLERAAGTGCRLLLSGRQPAGDWAEDSRRVGRRLRFATPLVLASLVEEEKIWALQARAGELGLKLPEKVCRWLLRHHTGDLGTLSRLLESLDYASLAAQRRLTVPFISGLLGKH